MAEKEYILVTGGAGYIGSHTVIELVNHGYEVIVVDSLVNSSYDAIGRIEYIVKKPVKFFNVDLRDHRGLSRVFDEHRISGVIHFAALKAVGESTQIPLEYYDNNIGGTLSLLKIMKEHEVKTIVFSSSATVYGDATRFENMIPIPEHCPNDPTNPYGKTKYMIENILKDIHASDNKWRSAILRYFNPIGAHPSGLIGEDPLGIPNNLLPYLAQVAIGRREKLSVFGNDYNSHDGTPIRDYLHVVDLARGHIAALKYLNGLDQNEGLLREWNLGTGKGSTVFDVYHAFCKAVGRELPYEVVGRRSGDVLDLTANATRANTELKWKAKFNIEDACRDLWKWTTQNPFGYKVDNYNWKQFEDGFENRLHTITAGDLKLSIANYGALIQDLVFKGKSVVSKFENGEDYRLSSNPFFGTTVGRYANRIANGRFVIDGKEHSTTKNENGKNTLHGGEKGLDKKTFLGPVLRKKEGYTSVSFVAIDDEGANGFPGKLETYVDYKVSNEAVEIEYEVKLAEDSESNATAVNITNHSYFNITGKPSIDGSVIKSSTKRYLEVDEQSRLPSSKIVETKADITKPYELKDSDVFDYCFVVDEEARDLDTRENKLREVFEVSHPNAPFTLKIATTEPAFQFYTGDGVDTKGHGSRCGFCIEPSRFVNAVNVEPWKPQVVLTKDTVYGSKIKYSFA